MDSKRLIDADALVKDIEEYQKSMVFHSYGERMHFDDMIDFAVDHLNEAPAIDAVPVVRCKDCIHRHESEFCECRPDDAFCSDGEK